MILKEGGFMRYIRAFLIDILVFVLIHVLCFSLVSPAIINSAIQNDSIAQELTQKVMTVINKYTYNLPDISLQKIQSDIQQSDAMSELTHAYTQAIFKQIETGKENKEDMTPYINDLAETSFNIIEQDSDITLPGAFKTTITQLISSGLVAEGINQYVTEFINKQSPRKLEIIRLIYKLTLNSTRIILIGILVVLSLIQLLFDKLKGLRALSITAILSGLSVAVLLPIVISNAASHYLERTVVFDISILNRPGMLICIIGIVGVLISQLFIYKKNKSQF